MRKLLILAGLLVVLALVASTGMAPSAQATTMCTTTCPHSTLTCVPVTSCSSVPGTSITCDGVVTTCSASDSWCACSNHCLSNLNTCLDNCTAACQICDRIYNTCINSCGTQPPHSSC
jgi:hypothetical protein